MKNFWQISLVLAMVQYCHSLYAQTAPSIEWEKSLGGSDYEVATSIQQTTDGGYIVGGSSTSNDGDVTGHHGITYFPTDYWIVKLDASGSIVWQKSLGGSETDDAHSIQQTADGGFIVAGNSFSNDGDVTGHHGSFNYSDCWIIKLDSIGNLLWQKSLGGSLEDWANSVQQTIEGGFIVAGYSLSTDGDVSENHGDFDDWVVKLDSAGNLIWQKSLGGTYYDVAWSIRQTADSGYIVAGDSRSNDGDVSGNHGGLYTDDLWVVKLDMDGNLVWQKSLGGTALDYASSIQQTTNGGYIVAGLSYSNDGDVSGNHDPIFYGDYWIVRLDTEGNLVWQKPLGGSNVDYATSIEQTIDGGFIVAGASSSNNGDVSDNHSGQDYWIVKLDSGGIIIWQKSLGGSTQDIAYSIEQTTDAGFIIAGGSFSNDGDVSGNHGNNDYWIVKLSGDRSGIASLPNNFISLFPNPVHSQLTINLATSANEVTFRVYDVQGRVISLPISFQSDQAQLNTENLPDGFYSLQIINNKTGVNEVGKFVKQY